VRALTFSFFFCFRSFALSFGLLLVFGFCCPFAIAMTSLVSETKAPSGHHAKLEQEQTTGIGDEVEARRHRTGWPRRRASYDPSDRSMRIGPPCSAIEAKTARPSNRWSR